jgi:hypothetical protein
MGVDASQFKKCDVEEKTKPKDETEHTKEYNIYEQVEDEYDTQTAEVENVHDTFILSVTGTNDDFLFSSPKPEDSYISV